MESNVLKFRPRRRPEEFDRKASIERAEDGLDSARRAHEEARWLLEQAKEQIAIMTRLLSRHGR